MLSYLWAVLMRILLFSDGQTAARGPDAARLDVLSGPRQILTLRLLMSYTYGALVKPEMLTSYIYGPTFGNAETVSFCLLHNVSTLNQCREVSCVTFVCKHFAS